MRQSTIALILLTVAVGVGLFLIKYRVQSLEVELRDLNRDIAADRQLIHVLKAEWSHFNEPDRLRTLAGRHLDMIPIQSEQVVQSDRVSQKLQTHHDLQRSQIAEGNNKNPEEDAHQ